MAEEVAGRGDDVGGVVQTADHCVEVGVGGNCVGYDGTDVGGPGCKFVEGEADY